jgi:predicted regulator of Ras-like GTPase activity (Roadblock/LC7/MglB family)
VTVEVVDPIEFAAELKLQGISGTRLKPLAIINNKTFSVGETREVKVKGEWVKVTCTEIKATSVVVTANGASKELSLSQR